MSRQTIDYGIDLGTTNSSIAVSNGGRIEVVRNLEEHVCTPSVVYEKSPGELIVGRAARERLLKELDGPNGASKFKLAMGKQRAYQFKRSGRTMTAEELSAEVLKSLRGDVRRRYNEDIEAAVITIPAVFKTPRCAATEEAAKLAGLTHCMTLQEPSAAAYAHPQKEEKDRALWLVYDFGGGTFDVVLIEWKNGRPEQVGHEGDEELGGNLIDKAIVRELLLPHLKELLPKLPAEHPRWRHFEGSLELAAEQAKIFLSQPGQESTDIDELLRDDRGNPVDFHYTLERREVERLSEPLIVRSINICRKLLADHNVAQGRVSRILLVGGPTMTPYLRERLRDAKHGLGIPLDFTVDPLTVVAQGAAKLAATELLPPPPRDRLPRGHYQIQLQYCPVGADLDPPIAGKVVPPQETDVSRYTIEFVNAQRQPPWRSGKIQLSAEGAFLTHLLVTDGENADFAIELCDPRGRKLNTTPDRVPYRHSPRELPPEQRLTNSMGLVQANNTLDKLLEKGRPLPAKAVAVHRTMKSVRKGQVGGLLRVTVAEGENVRRADRNELIGYLEIPADQIKRDVPAGSDIEITLNMDESRRVHVSAYLPVLDDEFPQILTYQPDKPDPKGLRTLAEFESKRHASITERAHQTQTAAALEVLRQIDAEHTLKDVEVELPAVEVDETAAARCQHRLRALRQSLDTADDYLEWPGLLLDAQEALKEMRRLVEHFGEAKEKELSKELERELRQAMETSEPSEALRIEQIREPLALVQELVRTIQFRYIEFWRSVLEQWLKPKRAEMPDQVLARKLFAEADEASARNDKDALEAKVRELVDLLPEPPPGWVQLGHTQKWR